MDNDARQLTREMRWLFGLFAALAFVAGFLLFGLSQHTSRSFSWTIKPPLTAAFLGASFWAACLLLAWTACQRTWARARAALPPVFSIAALLLIATLIHLDRFHRDLFGWFWVVVYAVVPPALLLMTWRQLRVPGSDTVEAVRSQLLKPLRVLLCLQATIMVVVGAALFLAPTGADAVWPWSLTPLTARAVGAFTLGFGIAALDAVRQDELTRFEGAALAYAALGVLELIALARYSENLTGSDIHYGLYVAFLITVLAAGVYGWLRARGVSRARG